MDKAGIGIRIATRKFNFSESYVKRFFTSFLQFFGVIFPKPDKVVLMKDGAPLLTAKQTLHAIQQRFAKVWLD